MFRDERGFIISEEDLYREYQERIAEYDDGMTFPQYIAECCGKNGTLERI